MYLNGEGNMDEREFSEYFSRRTRPLIVVIFNLIVQLMTFMCLCIATVKTLPNIESDFLHIAKNFLNVHIISAICMIILSVMLIVGVYKMNAKLILLYLWVGFVRVLMFFPAFIALIMMACVTPESRDNIIWTLYRFVFYSLMDGYVLVNMYHYYQEIQNITDEEAV